MAEKKIIIEPEKTAGVFRLIPVVEQTTNYSCTRYGIYFWCHKKPVAVVLITHNEKKLLVLNNSSPEVDKSLAEMPQLSAILNS